ncbi:MAG TPA: hypothetical protein VGH32_11110, partial [Pirellulales bacterium]
RVRIVKPIIVRKTLVYRRRKAGKIVRRRLSPKRGQLLDLFDELINFTRVFPHPRLSLEVPLVEVEEWRYPGHGRRRWRRDGDFQVEDQRLIAIHAEHRFETVADLAALVSCPLPAPFHTGHLAAGMCIARWQAQRIAYCLRRMGALEQVGKERNAWLYRFTAGAQRTAAAA